MLTAESLSKYIEQLSALPPRMRLEAFRAIQDPADRQQVANALPAEAFSEILDESAVDNLNRNVRNRMKKQKPSLAA
jgi:Mg/Co/Ni transporter MgtE